MLATSSSTLVSMASQLSEAEERERAFCGRGRWNQVRTLAEAKNVMNFLLNLASSSRCQLRDREVDCREKDSEIRELKEKVINLVRQLELKKAEFNRLETLMKLALERQTEEKSSRSMANNSDGHAYDLRPKGSRNSTILDSGLYVLELPEDMDTSDDQHLYSEDAEWVHPTERKKHQSRKGILIHVLAAKSLCKTSRCECRAASGICSSSCSGLSTYEDPRPQRP